MNPQGSRVSVVLGLVVLVWVDGQVAEEFACDGVDDAGVEVVDEHDHGGSGVGSADASVDAQGEFAVLVDDVSSDPVMAVVASVEGWSCFGQGGVAGGWGAAVGQGAVGPVLVVVGDELVDQGL